MIERGQSRLTKAGVQASQTVNELIPCQRGQTGRTGVHMRSGPARKVRPLQPPALAMPSPRGESPGDGFRPRSTTQPHFADEPQERELRTYTEEQVAHILQISRSQLRKWRMGWSQGRREGPPFKKRL